MEITIYIFIFIGSKKTDRQTDSGVPQGLVLGPLLSILYVNNICEVSNTLKIILFAGTTI